MAQIKHTPKSKPKQKKYKFPTQGLKAIRKAQHNVENCISKAGMAR